MKRITVKQVHKMVNSINADGVISYNDDNNIQFSNGAILETNGSHDKIYRILQHELGFSTPDRHVLTQDEREGMSQAAENGQNPFDCTILG